MLGLGNLGQNLHKSINGIIPKEEHTCEQKRVANVYLPFFYNYVVNSGNKGFFTCLKDKYEKQRYLDLGNMEIMNALSKLSSTKLAVMTGNWYRQTTKNRYANFEI